MVDEEGLGRNRRNVLRFTTMRSPKIWIMYMRGFPQDSVQIDEWYVSLTVAVGRNLS